MKELPDYTLFCDPGAPGPDKKSSAFECGALNGDIGGWGLGVSPSDNNNVVERVWFRLSAKRLPTSSHIPIRYFMWGVGGVSGSFDAIDRPVCPYCGERAYLTRRTPHPDHDLRYELQIFICSACDHTIERIVDANGNPPPELKCVKPKRRV